MICTVAPQPAHHVFPFPGPSPVLSPRELYLKAIEHERNLILQDAYARKGAPYPSRSSSSSSAASASSLEVHPPSSPIEQYFSNRDSYFAAYPPSHFNYSNQQREDDQARFHGSEYDANGRLMDFRESVKERQARLEFLRRQEFARRLALKGLNDSSASEYAIKRLPPPHARPAERLNAAIKIQRAYRAHRASRILLRKLNNFLDELDSARSMFVNTQRKTPFAKWTPAMLRRATAGMRSYGSALANVRLDFAQAMRPIRMKPSLLSTLAHAQSVIAKIREVDVQLEEECEAFEVAKVDAGIGEMRLKSAKRPWMWPIEETEEEYFYEEEVEEEPEEEVVIYMTPELDSATSSPAPSLATLSDASLEELEEGSHQHIEVHVLQDEPDLELEEDEYPATFIDSDDDEDDVPTLRRTLALSLLYSASNRTKADLQDGKKGAH